MVIYFLQPVWDASNFSLLSPVSALVCLSVCRSKPQLSDTIPCPNSGLDAVKLEDGRVVLIYNHSFKKGGFQGRQIISLAVSLDDGASWLPVTTLEESKRNVEFSYPAVIQSTDGLVHVTYTWKRHNIRHLVIDPEKLSR